jgi:hypothetical protein
MYLFEVMDKRGNGKIYPDMAKETPYIVVNVGHNPLEATGGVSLNPVKAAHQSRPHGEPSANAIISTTGKNKTDQGGAL